MTESYADNMAFITSANERLERGDISIDELGDITPKFAAAAEVCLERLALVEGIVKDGLKKTIDKVDG